MSEKSYPLRLRTRGLKITVSEEDALAITVPFIQITAYLIGITSAAEMPAAATIEASVNRAKMRMASLLAPHVKSPVDPKSLSGFVIKAVPTGGYFKVSFQQQVSDGEFTVNQGYNVDLVSAGGPLWYKVSCIQKAEGEHTDDAAQNAKKIWDLIERLGI